jgi:holo-[acyl-carrier protein] synthase
LGAIVGIGLDLVELSRVARSLERWGDRLVAKLMDAGEAAALPPGGPARVETVAAAIALKEAASKALGTGWSGGVSWRHVIARPRPPAAVELTARAAEVARMRGSRSLTTSCSLETRGDLLLAEVWLLK